MKVPGRHLGMKKPRIEMLPLIDIVFLLLVFFIYAMLSMVVHHSMDLSLPVSPTAAVDRELRLSISVRHNGDIYLDDTRVTLEELVTVLYDRNRVTSDGKPVHVDLFADKGITYQELFHVLDSLRSAGISNVSLQADSPE
jgi:biopolymer transport protein ExbD